MRLWSLHPKYLDKVGLSCCFNEGKIGLRALLQGEFKECSECLGKGYYLTGHYNCSVECNKCEGTGYKRTSYYNHTQLLRFKETGHAKQYLSNYLWIIYRELQNRKMVREGKFNNNILLSYKNFGILTVTKKQLKYEFEHLRQKLKKRNYEKYRLNDTLISKYKGTGDIEPHPLFVIKKGDIETWEKLKK